MKALRLRQFGDPLLRKKAKRLTKQEIASDKIQSLIKEMRFLLIDKKLGVAMAAQQVGENLALMVVAIRPTEHRPHVEEFNLVAINPVITKTVGRPSAEWEGCLSSGDQQANLFAQVKRYPAVELSFLDERSNEHKESFTGLIAQVIQHETDHMDGVLFVDRVEDPATYMTMQEYRKRITPSQKP